MRKWEMALMKEKRTPRGVVRREVKFKDKHTRH